MKLFVLILGGIYFQIPYTLASTEPKETKFPYAVTLDLEDDDPPIQAFSKPGIDWRNCELVNDGKSSYCKESMGFLRKNAKVKVLEPKKMISLVDKDTFEVTKKEFAFVEFEYPLPNGKMKKEKGWIPSGRLIRTEDHDQSPDSFYSTSEPTKKCVDDCQHPTKPLPEKKVSQAHEITNAVRKNYLDQVNSITQKIQPLVGFCVDTKKSALKGNSIYADYVLPKIKYSKELENIPISKSDLINIDALSRTIYGEIANCFQYGLHYPMAVARISLNRAQNTKRRSEFISGFHHPDEPKLTQVVTSEDKYSVWRKDLNVDHALCPPSSPVKYWKGVIPSPEEVAIWKNSLRIATEAVLFPDSFKERSGGKSLPYYFYTSDMGKFYNAKQAHPKILGRSFDSSCLEIWQDPKKVKKTSPRSK